MSEKTTGSGSWWNRCGSRLQRPWRGAHDRRSSRREAAQEVRRAARRRRPRSRSSRGRVLRPARAQRRRQDHHGGDPRGPERTHGRQRRGARNAVGERRACAAPAARRLPSGDAPARPADGGGEPPHVPIVLPARPAGRGGPRPGGAAGEAYLLDGTPLRRAEAAPCRRLRAGERSGSAVSRRAHHRARSTVPPAALGRGARIQGPRQDGAADDALHGRGRAPLRPRRHRRQGQGDRAGNPPGADRFARRTAGGRARHRTASRSGGSGRASLGSRRTKERRRDRAHGRAAASRLASDPRARRALGAHTPVHAPRHPGRRLRPPHRKAPARVNAPPPTTKSARISSPLWELTLARLRIFFREPGAVFWTFGFPLLLSIALGVAFRNRPAQPSIVAVVSLELERALAADAQLRPRLLDGPGAEEALRTGKADLVVLPGPPISYLYDPARPESRLARALADAALHPRGPPATVDKPVIEPGSRYIDFLIPGLLGMQLMSAGMWGVGYVMVDMRTRKLLKRLVATRALFLLLELPVLLGFAYLVFQVGVAGSILLLLAVSLLGALAFAGLGLLVASRAQNTQTVSGLINLVMLPMFVTSGVFFSTARFPDGVQPLLRVLPLTALNDALRAVMIDGGGLRAVAPQCALLAGTAAITFVAALRVFRWR